MALRLNGARFLYFNLIVSKTNYWNLFDNVAWNSYEKNSIYSAQANTILYNKRVVFYSYKIQEKARY